MAPPSKIPAFFKFFLPEVSSNRLNLPLSFTLYLKGVLPDKVFLRDRNGNLWPVKVLKINNEHFFEEGWVKFIADTGVSLGNFLVFRYDGGNIFDFKLFGLSACEKEYTASCSIKVKGEREEKEKEVIENADKEEEIEVEEVGEEDIETDGMEVEEEDDEEDDDSFTVSDEENDDDEDYHESDKEEDVDDEEDDDDDDYEEEEDIEVKKMAAKNKSKNCRARVKKLRKRTKGSKEAWNKVVDIFKSGLIPLPANPFFIARLRPRNRNELYIPYEVIHDHNLEIPDEMIIRDKKGKKFVTRTATWKDGRKMLTDGYRDFCEKNKVKKEDRFLCEFLSNQELLIHVLHLQAGNWVLRP